MNPDTQGTTNKIYFQKNNYQPLTVQINYRLKN